jgi:AcrR family transcriptional regulator
MPVRPLAATTVTASTSGAGVGRVTVSRHLPDETALAWACSGRYLERRAVGVLAAPFRGAWERRAATPAGR